MRTEAEIAEEECFWEALGHGGLVDPIKVLIVLTDLEIERRQIERGLPPDLRRPRAGLVEAVSPSEVLNMVFIIIIALAVGAMIGEFL